METENKPIHILQRKVIPSENANFIVNNSSHRNILPQFSKNY